MIDWRKKEVPDYLVELIWKEHFESGLLACELDEFIYCLQVDEIFFGVRAFYLGFLKAKELYT